MIEPRLVEQLVGGKTLSGEDAAALMEQLERSNAYCMPVALALQYLGQGETQQAMYVLRELLTCLDKESE